MGLKCLGSSLFLHFSKAPHLDTDAQEDLGTSVGGYFWSYFQKGIDGT